MPESEKLDPISIFCNEKPTADRHKMRRLLTSTLFQVYVTFFNIVRFEGEISKPTRISFSFFTNKKVCD